MTLATKPANRLQRIQSGITEAQSEIDTLQGQIQSLDDQISSELGKVTYDKRKVATMEGERQELVRSQKRLSARIEALGKTLPAAEKVLAKSELKDAILEHGEAVDKVNEALDAYKGQGLELLRGFVELWRLLVDARLATDDVRDRVAYFAELLELERPKLRNANQLTDQEDRDLADVIRACQPMRPDPYRSSLFKAKLQELSQEKHDKEAAAAAIENKRVAQLAG